MTSEQRPADEPEQQATPPAEQPEQPERADAVDGPGESSTGGSDHSPAPVPATQPGRPTFVRDGHDDVPTFARGDAGDVADGEELRLHPAGIAVEAIRGLRGSIFAFIALLATAGAFAIPAIIGLAALTAIGAYVSWRVTRYTVVDGAIRLRSGLFSRKERSIPASRISALDTSRGILQRIFGVVALKVQTAGGGSTAELELSAVTFAEAERLRRVLGHRAAVERGTAPAGALTDGADVEPGEAADAGGPASLGAREEQEGEVVFRLPARDLVVAGVTSPQLAVVGAGAAALVGALGDAVGDRVTDLAEQAASTVTTSSLIVLGIAAVLLAAALSVAATVLAFQGFVVTRDDRRLRVRRGLLTERTGTVPLDRIHGLRIVESPVRQLLGYVAIEAEVAGWAAQDQTLRTIIPLVRRRDLAELVPRLVPGYAWTQADLHGVPKRAYRRYVWPPLWLAVPAAAALAFAPIGLAFLAPVPILLAVAWGLLAARDAGWRVDDQLVVLRHRGFGRSTVVAQIPRLQRGSRATTPFQRPADLAHFGVRLSSRRAVQVRHLERSDADQLLGTLRVRTSPGP